MRLIWPTLYIEYVQFCINFRQSILTVNVFSFWTFSILFFQTNKIDSTCIEFDTHGTVELSILLLIKGFFLCSTLAADSLLFLKNNLWLIYQRSFIFCDDWNSARDLRWRLSTDLRSLMSAEVSRQSIYWHNNFKFFLLIYLIRRVFLSVTLAFLSFHNLIVSFLL